MSAILLLKLCLSRNHERFVALFRPVRILHPIVIDDAAGSAILFLYGRPMKRQWTIVWIIASCLQFLLVCGCQSTSSDLVVKPNLKYGTQPVSIPLAVDSFRGSLAERARSDAGECQTATHSGVPDDRIVEPDVASAAENQRTPQQAGIHAQFTSDLHDFLPMVTNDARGLVNWNNLALLGVGLGGALAMRADLDDQVRANTQRHPERWGDGTDVLGKLGNAEFQVPALLALYAHSLTRGKSELHDVSGSLISAYTINGLSTIAIKGIANTNRPSGDYNDGEFGFPSFHTSSTFAMAAVLDEYYGPKIGLPTYAMAGLIGWSRIDQRDHDLSDVVFGAVLGYVIGKSVAGRHLRGDSSVRILPYLHPNDASAGVMFDIPF